MDGKSGNLKFSIDWRHRHARLGNLNMRTFERSAWSFVRFITYRHLHATLLAVPHMRHSVAHVPTLSFPQKVFLEAGCAKWNTHVWRSHDSQISIQRFCLFTIRGHVTLQAANVTREPMHHLNPCKNDDFHSLLRVQSGCVHIASPCFKRFSVDHGTFDWILLSQDCQSSSSVLGVELPAPHLEEISSQIIYFWGIRQKLLGGRVKIVCVWDGAESTGWYRYRASFAFSVCMR